MSVHGAGKIFSNATGVSSPSRRVVVAALLATAAATRAFADTAGTATGNLRRLPKPLDMPRFDLPVLSGGRARLEDFAGRPLVAAFWATWCPPCRRELPALARLATDLADQSCAVVSVDVGEPDERAARFLSSVEGVAALSVLVDRGREMTAAWRVVGLPTAYVLDASGKAVFAAFGEIDWDDEAVRRTIVALRPPEASTEPT